MSKFDENLFGRIAVLGGYITREQLEECLRVQRREDRPRYIGQILLERGYLSEAQVRAILAIRRQKVRKFALSREGKLAQDHELTKMVLEENLVPLERLEDAVLEQHRLRALNLHFTLAEVLLSRGDLDRDTVLRLLERQGRRMMTCGICDCHYRIANYRVDGEYRCLKCGSALRETGFLDDQLADGFLDSSEPEATDTETVTAPDGRVETG